MSAVPTGWHTVRVVVELSVQGDYSEKDLRWDVARCLEERLSLRHRRTAAEGTRFGAPQVKEAARVFEAVRRRLSK